MIRSFKLGISAYVRTPYQTAFQITALALGLSLITVLAVLRTDLLERWQQQLPEGTPNQFVYGLPPFENDCISATAELNMVGRVHRCIQMYVGVWWQKMISLLRRNCYKHNNSLRRELNLTQASTFPKDNKIVSGAKLHLSQ